MSNIKQAPFLGLTGMGGGGTGLALGGAVAKKTYIEDVFSNYLYTGTNSNNRDINNGIDLSGKGGLVMVRPRNHGVGLTVYDTKRGATKRLLSYTSWAEATASDGLTAFNSNGFEVGDNSGTNSDKNYVSFSFRNAPGFCSVVKYVGNGASSRTISHDLGCKPGLIIFKNADTDIFWAVWQKDLKYLSSTGGSQDQRDKGNYLRLSENVAIDRTNDIWPAEPTANDFTVGVQWSTNQDTKNIVAYVFAGGESDAATARSVFFDGDDDRLTLAATSDFAFGTGDFTLECWAKRAEDNDAYSRLMHFGPYWSSDDAVGFNFDDGDHANKVTFATYRNRSQGTVPSNGRVLVSSSNVYSGQWYHLAVTRSSGVFRLFINGTLEDTNSSITSRSTESSSTNTLAIAGTVDRMVGEPFDGDISNVRVIKGTALYTSSFKPPTKPLTNVTNTKLLCCNNSSTTGSTVTPGTITADGSPIAKTYSPFDDPDAFKFGEEGDQNIIKTGMWEGTATAGMEVNLGWQPSWIMFKNTASAYNWYVMDVMRGIVYGDDAIITANSNDPEWDSSYIDVTPTGFKIQTTSGVANENGSSYVYMAMRKSDGYVGKPPEAATDVFAIDTGDGNSTIPNFDSGFPVDFALQRPHSMGYTGAFARLLGHHVLYTATTGAEQDESSGQSEFDSNIGWGASSDFQTSSTESYMWKRSAGFDMVTYVGNSTGDYSGMSQVIPHNLGKSPEMIWCKRRDASGYWGVYHKGLNGGTNPENYRLLLNDTHAESAASGSYTNWYWDNTAPTATHFSVGEVPNANAQNSQIIAMLFASVSGISHVGSYSGSGSTGNAQNIGFQPRYLLIKRRNATSDWMQFNSLSGFDKYTQLNTNQQRNSQTYVNVSATGFSLVSDYGDTNESGSTYIYYAHA